MGAEFKKIEVGYLQENCYILIDCETKDAVIIDPGDEGARLSKEIDNMDVNVKSILLTHGHVDHTGAVDYLRSYYKTTLFMNKKDYEMIMNNTEVFGKITTDIPERFIEDGDEIHIGNTVINCISTPGHSPGGMCYLVHDLLFAGDTLFCSSVGRWDLPGGNYGTLMDSIRTKLLVLPDHTKVMTGHGPNTTIKNEKY